MSEGKWMPSWKHLFHFVKTDKETFRNFFSYHHFLQGRDASPEAYKRGMIRVNSKGEVEWSVNMFLKYWIDDRERKIVYTPQRKKKKDDSPSIPHKLQKKRKPVQIHDSKFQEALDRRVHACLHGLSFDPTELHDLQEGDY